MAETQSNSDRYGTWYFINSASSSDVLTWEQMKVNATYFRNYIADVYPTWTLNAIAAMLGNIQSEGAMNPSQWEYGYGMSTEQGYGLVQWTPATKFLNWAGSRDKQAISVQVDRMEYERANGEQYYPTSSYNFSFTDFLTGDHSVDQLARAWLYNYERPLDPGSTEADRVKQANTWYGYLSGTDPDPPGPGPGPEPDPGPGQKKGRLKPCFYHRFRYD